VDKFAEMFGGIDILTLVLVVIGCGIAVGVFWYVRKEKTKIEKTQEVAPISYIPVEKEKEVTEIIAHPGRTKESIKLGVGQFRTFVISESRPDYFSTIEKPVGNVFIAETSMPQSGMCYLVKEWADGFVED